MGQAHETMTRLRRAGVMAVVRLHDAGQAERVVEALCAGGVRGIEITMTVPGAVKLIRRLRDSADAETIIGAGTVTDVETADRVMDAGAEFVVGPNLDEEVIRACRDRQVVVAPGCFTPTEVTRAWRLGADLIKVFPASVLGPGFFKAVLAPLPDVLLMPTGGVTVENAGTWIKAGAAMVAIGGDLLDPRAIETENYGYLTERAAQLVANVREARLPIEMLTDGES